MILIKKKSLTQIFSSFIPGFLKSFVDRKSALWINIDDLILKKWTLEGITDKSLSQKICFFSHYDPHGEVAPYVLYYLKALKEQKIDIHFITTSPCFSNFAAQQVLLYCQKVIHRKNQGLDFGSWKIGLYSFPMEKLQTSHYEYLLIANDSVYGPLFSLENVFNHFQDQQVDFWGITQNKEKKPHLQSYFLAFSKKAFQSDAFYCFWKNLLFLRGKGQIISTYELGLSELAKKQGWKKAAYISMDVNENPTVFYWDTLIKEYGCPFLKTEVPRLNRAQSKKILELESFLKDYTSYDSALIFSHLKRIQS